MKAFFGKPEIKEKYFNRLKAHAEADSLIQGTGWESGKGCFIGCTLESYDHEQFEKELNIPEELAKLFDRIFERLESKDAKYFALSLFSSIEVGADTSDIDRQFRIWLMDFVLQFVQDEKFKKQKVAIEQVKRCWLLKSSKDDFNKARAAANAANAAYDAYVYDYAAWAANASSASAARADAAWAANDAADAAWAAANAACADVAKKDFWLSARNKLLELLRACTGEVER